MEDLFVVESFGAFRESLGESLNHLFCHFDPNFFLKLIARGLVVFGLTVFGLIVVFVVSIFPRRFQVSKYLSTSSGLEFAGLFNNGLRESLASTEGVGAVDARRLGAIVTYRSAYR
ncbi:uncharacterized protein TrAtP1_002603 [Trichoderma atroviride]|uniref:Uncharacterized protein n=1 Tax=Hypocrea atroviridis (strain ATCC 20476 / IMI 206040) TaxID=452589 RepID=G9P0L9_HYPAI|nr:uncharacterized protein TRIATDRAFT_319835 [Trichoderma atroviride IMI 206040]EHK42390.1 hypothetical protein TRIATDRAFT_319835 [Trichoderma atroviride IMI 206040]UKZ61337.1 hypothetical protein TrAtP1_002603 [Trichoderma atroviride]